MGNCPSRKVCPFTIVDTRGEDGCSDSTEKNNLSLAKSANPIVCEMVWSDVRINKNIRDTVYDTTSGGCGSTGGGSGGRGRGYVVVTIIGNAMCFN